MKRLMTYILSFSIFFLCGCYKADGLTERQKQEVAKLSFDNNISSNVVDTYMQAFESGDIEGMKSLGTDNFQKNFDDKLNKDVKVLGIRQESLSQNGLSALYEYTIIKAMENEPRTYLQNYYVKVSKEDDAYKVESAKAVPQFEVFREGSQLKIRKEDEVEIGNVMLMKNLPNVAYTKNDSGDTVMLKVPNGKYGPIGISYTGQKVAISTIDNEKSYVGVIEIDEAAQTVAEGGLSQGSSNEDGESRSGEEDKDKNQGERVYFDKLVGKNIKTIDIYNNVTLKTIVFSKDDAYVVVNYSDENNVTKFKFYRVNGEAVQLNLDSVFVPNKYNLIYKDYKDNEVYFDVTEVNNTGEIEENLLGSYKVSTKDFKINKL